MAARSDAALLLAAASLVLGCAAASTAVPAMGLPRIAKNPSVFELNTRVVMHELKLRQGKKASLDDFPDSRLDELERGGFDFVYMLGTWQTGKYGQETAKALAERDGLAVEGASSSPFAVTEYSVPSEFGGDAALERFRQRLHLRNMRLMLDFVPNHVAVDHPWTAAKPELFIQGTEEELLAEPANYFKVGQSILAHGRDQYFDGWQDTAQLDYGRAETRAEMLKVLQKMAGQCDGIRCDMAMLLCPEVMEATWGETRCGGKVGGRQKGHCWGEAIKACKKINDDCTFLAEVFWGREWELMQEGFDFTTDKALHDRLVAFNYDELKAHLAADIPFQARCARYLESHDDIRAGAAFQEPKQQCAAALLAYTVPGMKMMIDGQLTGRRDTLPLYMKQRNLNETMDPYLCVTYAQLVTNVLSRPEVRDGEWAQCITTPSMDQNPSWQYIFSHVCWDEEGHATLFVINYSGEQATGHVICPEGMLLARKPGAYIPNTHDFSKPDEAVTVDKENLEQKVLMRDLVGGGEFRHIEAAILLGHYGGVWFDLPPWGVHAFELSLV